MDNASQGGGRAHSAAEDPGRTAPLLVGEELVRIYSGRKVVEVDHIEVRTGEVLALLGPNGAGKSTLMRLLAGLETPDAGRVVFRGRTVRRDDPELRRAAAGVLQRPYLWRGTVARNVEFALKARRVPARQRGERVRRVLEELDIGHLAEASVDTLSGGEGQRVGLARALALEPQLLFLDEPSADLDVAVRRRLLADLERILRHAAPAIVLITHDPGEAFALADRVAVMESGRVIQEGSPEALFESPATEFVASFTGAELMLNGVVEAEEEGTVAVRLESGQLLAVAGDLRAGQRVRVAYRPEDVIVGPLDSPATSARNRFRARVARLHPRGGLVRLRLETGPSTLEAVITRSAREELGLSEGSEVIAQIKATALHAFRI
jgi:molybdopterin-binding protein